MVMDWVRKLTDIIMPIEPEEEEEEKVQAKEEEKVVAKNTNVAAKKVATGGGKVSYTENINTAEGSTSIGGIRYTAYSEPATATARPSLTVVKPHDLTVKIYMPENFDEVVGIADDILGKKAAVVNYERVVSNEQRRISDFVNGVCYISNGSVTMISDKIFLYMPAGVEAGEIARVATSMRIR